MVRSEIAVVIAASIGIAGGCSRKLPDHASEVGHEAPSRGGSAADAAPGNATANDAAPGAASTEDAGAAALATEMPDIAAASNSLQRLCADFLDRATRDAAEIAATFSFRQLTPRCHVAGVPAHWKSGDVFLDARVVTTTYVSRDETRLAIRLARGWVLTPIAWDVRETESATPMWNAHAPERFEATGPHLVVYLGGDDVHRNRQSPKGATRHMLRGAYGCYDDGARTKCWEWNPTEQFPLGAREGPKGPWSEPRVLVFPKGAGGPFAAPGP